MRISSLIDEDFSNYKEAAMFIGTISCGGKCCLEANIPLSVCQNDEFRQMPIITLGDTGIVKRYMDNPYTSAIVFGGLEPFEQFNELIRLIREFRKYTSDMIVIYTGYEKAEIEEQISLLKQFPNIILKMGRFIPNLNSKYDDVLGVELASNNQYAERIS